MISSMSLGHDAGPVGAGQFENEEPSVGVGHSMTSSANVGLKGCAVVFSQFQKCCA